MKKSQLRNIIKEEIKKVLKENISINSDGKLVSSEGGIPSMLEQLLNQGFDHLLGYHEGDEGDKDEWVSEWDWEAVPYRMLSNDINFIAFIDNDVVKLRELYKDAINWHPRFKEFQESFVESYFIKGVQDAYKGDLKRINTMMDVGPTGTTDKLTMVKLNNQNQLLYFFNI
tara:strand:+ start:73 stop:585 length:513 start_codon:yes stop_codon:yes gene_type:complete